VFDILYQDPLWLSVIFAALAVITIGLAKAGFGGSVGIIAVPLMAASMRTDLAVGVMLPILIAGDAFSLIPHRKHAHGPTLRPLLIGLLFGVAAGALAWWKLRNTQHLVDILNLGIGGLCLALVAYQLAQLVRARPIVGKGSTGFGVLAGAAAAFVSTIAHSAGPVVTLYLLALKVGKKRLVGSMVLFFTILNLVKVPVFLGLDLITLQTMTASLWLVAFIPIGVAIGYWMHHRVPERPFTVTLYVATIVAAGHMIWKGAAG